MKDIDVIIVGSGLAGVVTALSLREDFNVLLVTKKKLQDSNSYLAQGGINILKNKNDREVFIEDTLKAGHYKNDRNSFELMVDKSVESIEFLIDLGVEFTSKNGEYSYGREGGHSTNRCLHIDDEVGKNILDVLYKRLKERKNITIIEDTEIIDIIEHDNICYGVYSKNNVYLCNNVVFATGGIGGLFNSSTNYSHITGDAISIALRHNIELKDLSYIQFHPTSLYEEDADRQFLISESARGEGAILLNHKNERFVDELKPRDIVANAIYNEMEKESVNYEFLSLKAIGADRIYERFPMIFKNLMDRGIDPRKENLRIVPAEHYFMGGIKCDTNGRTNLKGFFVVGETGNVGIHGSNRLACNSLLECLVFGRELAFYINNNKIENEVINFKLIRLKKMKKKTEKLFLMK